MIHRNIGNITYYLYTVEEKRLCTIGFLWSKTTLITGSLGRAEVNPSSRKMDTLLYKEYIFEL